MYVCAGFQPLPPENEEKMKDVQRNGDDEVKKLERL